MSLLKIIDGTVSDTADLCLSCDHLQRVIGHTENEQLRYCQRLDRMIHFRVSQCSTYSGRDGGQTAYGNALQLRLIKRRLHVYDGETSEWITVEQYRKQTRHEG